MVKVAYITCLTHSSACNKDRATGGCPVKRQVSSRLSRAVLSVTLTDSSAVVSLWCDFEFPPCKSPPSVWVTPEAAGDRARRLQYGQRSNQARVLNLHVAHPMTRALHACLPSSVQPATFSPFLTSMMRQRGNDNR